MCIIYKPFRCASNANVNLNLISKRLHITYTITYPVAAGGERQRGHIPLGASRKVAPKGRAVIFCDTEYTKIL